MRSTEGPNERKDLVTGILDNKVPQMSVQLELPLSPRGEVPPDQRSGEASSANKDPRGPGRSGLLETVLSRRNLQLALKRVRKNKGKPGVDGMSVDTLVPFLVEHWLELKDDLLSGQFKPAPVRAVHIPKDGGKTRMLGIPTVVDRLIQQALLQRLQPIYDPNFSTHSYGFRPKRGAHGALCDASQQIRSGKLWTVDVDLAKFFDRVDHDILMGRLARTIKDRRVLKLIRAYLRAGIMSGKTLQKRREGTPQGSPLSPLLANILLDDVDKELERLGHSFVRYADDLRVFVYSKRAGERVMRLLRHLFGKLKLAINEEKSAVAPFEERPFLGHRFYRSKKFGVGLVPSKKSIQRFKLAVRAHTSRAGGRSIHQVIKRIAPILRGWRNYFTTPISRRDQMRRLGGWVRRRLRAVLLRQWRTCRTITRKLRGLGATERLVKRVTACVGRWWFAAGVPSNATLNKRFFDKLGLPRLVS